MINFSMDFLCFYLTARIMSARFSVWRCVLASAIGGVYAVLALFLSTGRVTALLTDMAVCSLMTVCAFLRKKELRSTLSYIPVYIAVSIVLGGTMTVLFNLLDRLSLPLDEIEGDGVSVWLFALFGILSGVLTLICTKLFARRGVRRSATVTVEFMGRSTEIQGLCDSGNLLREPISNYPCIVTDKSLLTEIFPKEVLCACNSGADALAFLSEENAKRTRLIPARSVTGDGMLIGFRPDRIAVDTGKGARTVSAYVVLSDIDGTADKAGALVPPELM
jgi:stage II sporulation protein GA (sporulation sigma-E factor processing peptidase)